VCSTTDLTHFVWRGRRPRPAISVSLSSSRKDLIVSQGPSQRCPSLTKPVVAMLKGNSGRCL
jgi:hypothetical protein